MDEIASDRERCVAFMGVLIQTILQIDFACGERGSDALAKSPCGGMVSRFDHDKGEEVVYSLNNYTQLPTTPASSRSDGV